MKRERTLIGGLLVLQLVLLLGFLVHRSPRFPGSAIGGTLAVAAALLIVLPTLVYSAVKRIDFARRFVLARVSLGTLLNWHVYTVTTGSILAIIHTGHRFESNLGIALTFMMLVTVFSGFIGRYFLAFAVTELHEKRDLLNRLATEYNQIVGQVRGQPDLVYAASHGYIRRAFNSFLGADFFLPREKTQMSRRAVRLAESIADLEYAIQTHELLKKRTSRWLVVHIATSLVFFVLLGLHIWSGIYFGIRWFD
jgi:hypothetical protein